MDACQKSVLKYLTDQNRPYSANDIVLNMHKEHGKTAVQKALDSLVAETKVVEKLNGKQKAYVVNQENLPTASEAELVALDTQMKSLEGELQVSNGELKNVDSQIKSLTSQPTNSDARQASDGLREDIERLEAKLQTLTDANRPVITKKDKQKVEKAHEEAVKEWRKRKRMCSSVMDAILEGYPKPKKDFIEDVGIETDEDVGAKMPDY